jgi:thiamine-phosphate pyrophosphorylase
MIMYMSDILCVTNRKLCREDFLTRIERIAACHPAGIILREKDMNPADYKELAAAVMGICEQHGVKCILHSFTDAAISLHAQAIHLPLHLLREMSQEQKSCFTDLGASCHSVEDALEAQALGCTYITAGHVFETDCKKGLPGRGLDFLRNVCAAVEIPVYGIGGIDSDNIALVRNAGASGACLMSRLMVTEDAARLLKAMEG